MGDVSQTTNAVQPEGEKGKDAAMIIYGVMLIIMALAFVSVILMSIVDICKYYLKEADQFKKVTLSNKQIFIKDTNDYSILEYPTKTIRDEPYLAYKEQSVISTILIVASIVFVGVFAQFGWYGYKVVRAEYGQGDKPKGIPINNDGLRILVSIVILTIGAMALTTFYKSYFIGQVQPTLIETREKLREVRLHVIRNLPLKINETFWIELQQANTNEISERVATLLASATSNRDRKAQDAKKILFAANVYGYFKNMIPDSDTKASDMLKSIFSSAGNKKDNDINKLFYYNNIPVIQDLSKDAFKNNILQRLRTKLPASGSTPNPKFTKASQILNDVLADTAIASLNEKLAAVRNIKNGKGQLFNFFVGFLVIAIVFLGGFIAYNWNILGVYVVAFGTIIWAGLRKLWNTITSKNSEVVETATAPSTQNGPNILSRA